MPWPDWNRLQKIMQKTIWAPLGFAFFLLGLMGAVLPLLPCTPFMLLAVFCFTKSDSKLKFWILSHKVFGPLILDWQTKGVIRRRAKWMATLAIGLASVFTYHTFLSFESSYLILYFSILFMVLLFIWGRPEK